MNKEELKELMSIICEGQDSEQRRKVENFIEYQVQLIDSQDKEIERLNNIIYTTLEYVDRAEINSIGKPFIYTEIGKHIKELLEGGRTFNSLWQENKRLNNIINGMEKFFQYAYDNEVREINDRKVSVWTICLDKLQELRGSENNE